MAKKLRRLLRIATLALLFAGTAMAQSTSSITGVVTDASTGKPVVGAVVVVTSPALEAEQTAVTEEGGKYAVPGLPAGDYTLAVQFEGYKPFERADLKVKEGTTLRANASVVPEAVQMEEVVVTGSRIRRKDLNTPAPVTVLNREAVQSSGKVSVGDFLQSLPEQGNAINTGVNNGGDGSVRISLRSLGDARTLVLVNGRRMVPGGSGADSSVDLNTIPTAAIERIEVLKDGASAVYGSDAIGGVVNIITRKNFNGADVSWYTGMSSKGDAQINDVALTFGSAGEGGSIIFSAGYYDQQKAMAGDRDFSKAQLYYDATGYNSGTPGEYKAGSSRTPGGRVSLAGNGNDLFDWYQGRVRLQRQPDPRLQPRPGRRLPRGGRLRGRGRGAAQLGLPVAEDEQRRHGPRGRPLQLRARTTTCSPPRAGSTCTRPATGSWATTPAPSSRPCT